jgi:hypothetical protein
MRPQRVDEERLAAEEGLPPILTVPAPELGLLIHPTACAAPESRERYAERQVEPDDKLRPLENDVAELARVVPVDDP